MEADLEHPPVKPPCAFCADPDVECPRHNAVRRAKWMPADPSIVVEPPEQNPDPTPTSREPLGEIAKSRKRKVTVDR